MIWVIFFAFAIASWIVSYSLQKKFKEYSNVPVRLSGKEVAEAILREHGIDDVKVTCIEGQLTDHYNPVNKTVNLSRAVYENANVAAAAVAAHECGHVLQHQFEYAPLQLRSALVPVVSFANKWVTWVILAGILALEHFNHLLLAGIILYAITTLFTFVTLPVEIDASRRALTWLETSGLTDRETTPLAASALRTAAFTYVIAALGSLATLIYYIAIFTGTSRD